jgi:hypothetical protein
MTLLQASTDAIAENVSLRELFFGGTTDELVKISLKFICRLVIDLLAVILLTRVYHRVYRHSELFFTFFTFNIVIFLICFMLNRVDLSMGAAFGLFAVFSMLRYRTEDISLKDMTYLFLVIAIGLISAVTKIRNTADFYEFVFIIFVNLIIVFITYVFESGKFYKKEIAQVIVYENIEMIKSQKKDELMEDLRQRTGLNIHRISVGKIDFLRDTALIKVYYYEK